MLGGAVGLAKKTNYARLNKRDHSFESSDSALSDQANNQAKLKPIAIARRPRLGTDGATLHWLNQVNDKVPAKILNSPPIKLSKSIRIQ